MDAFPATSLPAELEGYALAVVDLDESGTAGLEALRAEGFTRRVVGFYSHVNESLGAQAHAAGIEAYPRGRFWRELEQILSS